MLDGEHDVLATSCEIGVAISKGMKVAAATQCLAGLCASFLAGVMDQDDGDVESALQLS